MWSIALFPCSYTDGARIIGELSYSLNLQVYTDEMLFSEVSARFGLPVEKLTKVIYEKNSSQHQNTPDKEKYINMLSSTLTALMMLTPRKRMYYGLHTSLLDPRIHRVLRVLVMDDKRSREKRAMQQEGLSEEVAGDHIRIHDEQAFTWTRFLFQKDAYDRSLYDIVVHSENRDFFDLTAKITRHYKALKSAPAQPPIHDPLADSGTTFSQIIKFLTEPDKTPVSL